MQKNPDIAVTATGDTYVVWQDSSVALKTITLGPDETYYAYVETTPKNLTQIPSGGLLHIGATFKNNLLTLFNKFIYEFKSTISHIGDLSISARDLIYGWRRSLTKSAAQTMRINEAKAVGTIVQSIKVSGIIINNNTVTMSFNNPPTAGNLMIRHLLP
jgi:hypothetical protein